MGQGRGHVGATDRGPQRGQSLSSLLGSMGSWLYSGDRDMGKKPRPTADKSQEQGQWDMSFPGPHPSPKTPRHNALNAVQAEGVAKCPSVEGPLAQQWPTQVQTSNKNATNANRPQSREGSQRPAMQGTEKNPQSTKFWKNIQPHSN